MGKRLRKVLKVGGLRNVPKEIVGDIKADKVMSKSPKPLDGSRFRWLNESLYTESSSKSFTMFQNDPKLFDAYHSGFRSQTKGWPVNPVDECLGYIMASCGPGSTVGDFGCGDAKLAQRLKDSMSVHSFDLVSVNPLVTACNIACVPLEDSTLDIAVFSLSLMGTDWPRFVSEAQRCLKVGGTLYIAEVQSRFKSFEDFVEGFGTSFEVLRVENPKDRYFVTVVLKKRNNKPLSLDPKLLKPCIYKKR
jgi:ribosomal RNA-processing protein 8